MLFEFGYLTNNLQLLPLLDAFQTLADYKPVKDKMPQLLSYFLTDKTELLTYFTI